MKKKVLAVVLALCMMLSLIPFSFAEETETAEPTTQEKVEAVMEAVSDSLDNGQPEEAQEALSDALDTSTDTEPTLTEEEQETPLSDVVGEEEAGQVEEALEPEEQKETPAEEQKETPAEEQEESDLTIGETIEEMEEAIEEGQSEVAEEVAEILTEEESAEEEVPAEEEIPAEEEVPFVDAESAYEYLMTLQTEEEIDSYLGSLTEEQLAELAEYARANQPQKELPPAQTNVQTEAAPFVTNVKEPETTNYPLLLMSGNPFTTVGSSEKEPLKNLSVVTQKKATGDGTYTVEIDAFTTGEVTVTTKEIPVDVVLVLDQSGSMQYGFNEDKEVKYDLSRQKALKVAVSNFIKSVADKYDATKCNHRISIVTFASSATELTNGLVNVDSAGASALQEIVNGLPEKPTGATYAQDGMAEAKRILVDEYTGGTETRNRVVLFFTDGVPTTGDSFETGVATKAIQYAKSIKEAGATVYSIGIFGGADPDNLYGDLDYFGEQGLDTTNIGQNGDCDIYRYSRTGAVGEEWLIHAGYLSDFEFTPEERVAGNRFLNYLSSNYKKAETIGITFTEKYKWYWGDGLYYYDGYEITANYATTGTGYYLTADDEESLNNIFQSISSHFAEASIKLGEDAYLKDVVTKYFTPQFTPNDWNEVEMYIVPCIRFDEEQVVAGDDASGYIWAGEEDWLDARQEGVRISASTDEGDDPDRAFVVSGFDYDKNFVTKKPKTAGGSDYGSKLHIEFKVDVREGFWGGKQVPTNDEGSGIYDSDGKAVEELDVPKVDVPLDVDAITSEKNINLYYGINVEDVPFIKVIEAFPGATDFIECEYENLGEIQADQSEGHLDALKMTAWRIGDESNKQELTAPVDWYTFYPTIYVTAADGEGAESGVSYDLRANCLTIAEDADWYHEYTKAVAFPDGTTVSAGDTKEASEVPMVKLLDGETLKEPSIADTDVTVTLEFADSGSLVGGESYTPTTNPEDNFNVVSLTYKGLNCPKDASGYPNGVGCVVVEPAKDDGHDFTVVVDVLVGSLTLQKDGLKAGDSAIFVIRNTKTGNELRVSIKGSNSKVESLTIKNLPIGDYEIEEEGWSWKYSSKVSPSKVEITQDETVTVTVTNTYAPPQSCGINAEGSVLNKFGTVTSAKS